MGLSRTGCVAAHYWRKIAELNDSAVLDAFVVMPNHVHGLLGLDSKQTDDNASGGSRERSSEEDRTRMSQISPEAGSVSTMIRSYKSAVTKRVRGTLRTDFGWQRRFHDHIVRSEQAFNAIRQYIVDNPSQWRQDEHHPSQIEEKAF